MKELVEDLKIANDNLYSANKMLEKEIERLKKELEEYKKDFKEANDLALKLITNNKEYVHKSIKIVNILALKIERLNNIINELEKEFDKELESLDYREEKLYTQGIHDTIINHKYKLQELKGSDKE